MCKFPAHPSGNAFCAHEGQALVSQICLKGHKTRFPQQKLSPRQGCPWPGTVQHLLRVLCLDVTPRESPLMSRALRVLGGLSSAELQEFTPNLHHPARVGPCTRPARGQVPAHGGEGDGFQARPLILDIRGHFLPPQRC